MTGDFIDGSVAARRRDIAPLRDLAARDGTWFIPGNHEYFFGYDACMRNLTSLGLRPLVNGHTLLRRGADRLVLAGVSDLSAPETGNAPPDLNAALVGAPSDVAVVLLDHQPKHALQAAKQGVALQLSGHTHGGMIRGLDRIIAMANGGYVSGRYDVAGMTLYVSNGTALWPGFALRLGVRSEITRITLRPKKQDECGRVSRPFGCDTRSRQGASAMRKQVRQHPMLAKGIMIFLASEQAC